MPNEAVGDHIGLKHLWQLQEQAFSYNCQQSRPLQDALGLLDRSVRLNLSILTAMRFGAAKQTVIRVLAADALSRIIVAARIGIWGALPECLSVLRGATESCAQLTLTVSQNLYETALQEINGKKLVRLKFEAVCKDLGELGTAFRRRHSKMSDLAAHATASSLRQAEYRKDGESYDRLGAAESPRNAEIATSECLEYLALVAVATLDAYSKDAIEEVWLATLSELNLSHGALKNQISAT
ncbi:MAG: hypothetical protein ACRD4R_16615 [Candidatus Acidiferrales bacterium]